MAPKENTFPLRNIYAILLLSGAWLATPLLAADRFPTYGTSTKALVFEGKDFIRYGNWYGPGWWGGSQDPTRVGMLAPIDSLDAVAQKHDFGYKVAELLGNGRPAVVAHYMAIADAIAARDAARLPKDPADWPLPPTNVKLARDLRDRMAVGFGDIVQHVNAVKGASQKRFDHTDEEEMEGLLNLDRFEAKQNAEVAAWNKEYAKWQAKKAAKKRSNQFNGTWFGTYTNSRNEPGTTEISLAETDGKVEGTDGGMKIIDGTKNGATMHWRLERDGGFAKGGCSWNVTAELQDNGNTLIERYTGHDHRTDKKDGGSYSGVATLHRR